jgi:hypothetical protein
MYLNQSIPFKKAKTSIKNTNAYDEIVKNANLLKDSVDQLCDLGRFLYFCPVEINKKLDIFSSDATIITDESFNQSCCERLARLASTSKEICFWLSLKNSRPGSSITLTVNDLKPNTGPSKTKSLYYTNDPFLWSSYIYPINFEILEQLQYLEIEPNTLEEQKLYEENNTYLSMIIESFQEELDQIRNSHDFDDDKISCLVKSLTVGSLLK